MNLPVHLPQVVLQTSRLFLKEVSPEIMQWLFAHCADEELMAWLGLNEQNLPLEKRKVAGGMTTWRMTYKMFILVDKESGKAVGRCALHNWHPEHRRAELGYNIATEELKGKGYMREALREIVKYGFEQMNLNRIDALLSEQNTPSLRLVLGLGFLKEGVLRQHWLVDGRLEDSSVFALLKSEYESQHEHNHAR